jgi:hypothetical protein
MRFEVPQFIEVEDKIFGPLTIKQFVYLAGGAGLSFVAYVVFPFYIAVLFIIAIMGFSCTLAFLKVNQRFPFVYMLEAATKYYFGTKLFLWRKTNKPVQVKTPQQIEDENMDKAINNYASVMVPRISESKLKDLSWSLDVKEKLD